MSGIVRKAWDRIRRGGGGGPDLVIRLVRKGEIARLREITAAVFGGVSLDEAVERRFGRMGGAPWQERKASHIDTDYRIDPRGVLVAEIGGEIVGYVTTSMDLANRVGYIANMAVAAESQGKGVGRRLVEAALDRFRRAGLTGARIATLETNKVGRHLYPAMGFEEVARQIYFYKKL